MDYSLENLSEEDFTSLYNFRNIFLNYGSIYAYLAYNEFIEFPENEVVAELKIDKTDLQGQHYLKTTINNDDTTIKRILNIIYESYKNGNIPSNKE